MIKGREGRGGEGRGGEGREEKGGSGVNPPKTNPVYGPGYT
jgi:hypothetical protein